MTGPGRRRSPAGGLLRGEDPGQRRGTEQGGEAGMFDVLDIQWVAKDVVNPEY